MGKKTGRRAVQRIEIIVKVLVFVIRLLPLSIRKFLYSVFQNTYWKLGILIRYILIRSISKKCGVNVSVHKNVVLNNIDLINFGDNVSIHSFCYIEGCGGLTIGNDVSIAHSSSILTTNHTYDDRSTVIKYNDVKFAHTTICDDVWIGCGCRVLAGVTIQSRAVVAAGAVVVSDVQESSIYGGVPAKKIKAI